MTSELRKTVIQFLEAGDMLAALWSLPDPGDLRQLSDIIADELRAMEEEQEVLTP